MEWNKPDNGDERIVKRFALLPIRIYKNVKWLKMCYIRQVYIERYGYSLWNNLSFVTKDEYIRTKEKENG